MSIAINSFPVLSPELYQRIGFFPGEYQFQYMSDGTAYDLSAEPIAFSDSVVKIIDDRCEWTPDLFDIHIRRDLRINTPVHLFGENGVIASNGEIGIAVEWTSKSSNQRGIVKVGSFKRTTPVPTFSFGYSFSQGRLSGSFTLNTILYVADPGVQNDHETHLAKVIGTILGELDSFCVVIDGNGSVFPIVEVNVPAHPLWWVVCNWTDPIVDLFNEENVKICLNSAHKDYGMLNVTGGLKDSPMLREVIASALQIIVLKIKDSEFWQDTLTGTGLTEGSVSQAVYYFISTFSWDYQSPEHLAMSIRKDLDERVG